MKKFKKIFNTRTIKSKKSYSTQEIANLFGIHLSTVHSWYRSGLKKNDSRRPAIVFGLNLINFLKEKNQKGKKKCNKDEFFCCKCKSPQKSKDNKVNVKIMNPKRVMMRGICEKCGTKMNKSGVPSKIEEYKKLFVVQEIQEEKLLGCANTSVSTSEKRKANNG